MYHHTFDTDTSHMFDMDIFIRCQENEELKSCISDRFRSYSEILKVVPALF